MIDRKQFIDRDPNIMLGKPVFKGTRITVEFILDRLAHPNTTSATRCRVIPAR